MAENKENKTQQMTKAQEEVARLLNNSMGLIPSATVWDIYSRDIEKTVTRRLEKGGINTDSITVRCILTSNVGASRHLSRAAESTNLPFLVVVFKTLVADDDYEIRNQMKPQVRDILRRNLNNFTDNMQLTMKDDTPLNRILCAINRRRPHWELMKGKKTAYTILDSGAVMQLCFKIEDREINNYVFDFLNRPKSRLNPETRQQEFMLRVAVSRTRARKKPAIDPINMIR